MLAATANNTANNNNGNKYLHHSMAATDHHLHGSKNRRVAAVVAGGADAVDEGLKQQQHSSLRLGGAGGSQHSKSSLSTASKQQQQHATARPTSQFYPPTVTDDAAAVVVGKKLLNNRFSTTAELVYSASGATTADRKMTGQSPPQQQQVRLRNNDSNAANPRIGGGGATQMLTSPVLQHQPTTGGANNNKESKVRAKIAYNRKYNVVYLEDNLTIHDFMHKIGNDICRFPPGQLFTAKWLDDDNDLCTIGHQIELDEAIRLYYEHQDSHLVIHIFPSVPERAGMPCVGEDRAIKRRGAKQWEKQYLVNGHVFKPKRFHPSAQCALCTDRVWGLGRQGLRCNLCKVLVHKKCHRFIPFWCKSAHPTTTTNATNNNNTNVMPTTAPKTLAIQQQQEREREREQREIERLQQPLTVSTAAAAPVMTNRKVVNRETTNSRGAAAAEDVAVDLVRSSSINKEIKAGGGGKTSRKAAATAAAAAAASVPAADDRPLYTRSSSNSADNTSSAAAAKVTYTNIMPPMIMPTTTSDGEKQRSTRDQSYYSNDAATTTTTRMPVILPDMPLPPQPQPQLLPATPVTETGGFMLPSTSSKQQQQRNQENIDMNIGAAAAAAIAASAGAPPRMLTMKDFQLIKVIGRGSYAKVFAARFVRNNRIYAMKVIRKETVTEDEDIDWIQTEKHVFEQASNYPFLVGLHSCFQTPSRLCFVIEFVSGGDLMFHMQRQRRLPESHARFYASEIILALNYLHRRGIIYRDLKLDNVLLDSDGHIKLTDYGMCKEQIFYGNKTSTFCGTPNYIAPEILRGEQYDHSVDYWALGVLMYEMMAGRSPFDIAGAGDNPDQNQEDYLFQVILEKPIRAPRNLSVRAAQVLNNFLKKDPAQRLGCNPATGMADIQAHPFFRDNIDWEKLEAKQEQPPFRPTTSSLEALENFDETFTKEPVQLTPDDESKISVIDQTEFDGFEYVNPFIMAEDAV